MRDLTVIIPTYNMGRYLPALLSSIVTSDLRERLREILVVCDRSTDGSEDIIRKWMDENRSEDFAVQLLERPERKGVFFNRWFGANEAQTDKLLFLDSRIRLPAATATFLSRASANAASYCAVADIDAEKNVFNLYWLRSHAAIFSKRDRDLSRGPIEIRPENFDQYVVGTTGFYCSRSVFLKCCEPFLKAPVINDDTFLMRAMSAHEPIVIHPEFRIQWEPRDRAADFLKHLYNRGPGFAEYHVFEKRGRLFYALLAGIALLAGVIGLFFLSPLLGLEAILFCLCLAILSTAWMAKSFGEFVRLAPLHIAVLAAFGFGAIRGIFVIWSRRRSRRSV